MDFEESVRSSKVLQGQENVGLLSPLYRSDRINRQLHFEMQPAPDPVLNRMEKINYGEFVGHPSAPPATFTGFLESNWFPKVLQGQEICSFRPLPGKTDLGINPWSTKPQLGRSIYNTFPRATPSFYPLASEGARKVQFPNKGLYRAEHCPVVLPGYSNLQTEKYVMNRTPILNGAATSFVKVPSLANELKVLDNRTAPVESAVHSEGLDGDNSLKDKVPACKLFGFSLTEDPAGLKGPSKRSCTKVNFGTTADSESIC